MTTVSSVLLRARPDKLSRVLGALRAMPGVEVHADPQDGRLVLVIEDAPGITAAQTYDQLQLIEGVLNASLVYQYSDESYRQEQQA